MSRLERHSRLYRLCVAAGHPTNAIGVWPTWVTPSGFETTGFLPRPDSEFADLITTESLDRLESLLGVSG